MNEGQPKNISDRTPADDAVLCTGVRVGLAALGWFNVGLGVVGIVVPGMPTTVFLLIALWAFSRSSPRFHRWLYNHPRLGRTVRDWHQHRVIPLRAKLMAVTTMMASLVFVTVFVAESWILPGLMAGVMSAVAAFIVSRPSRAESVDGDLA